MVGAGAEAAPRLHRLADAHGDRGAGAGPQKIRGSSDVVQTILVCLNEVERIDALLGLTADIAQKQEAHVIGRYVIPAVQIYPAAGPVIMTLVIEGTREFFTRKSEKINSKFDEVMRRQQIRSEWRLVDSSSPLIAHAVIDHGREADLVIVSQADSDSKAGIEVDFVGRVVLESGRPVLIIPKFGEFPVFGRRALVGWNATRETARAAFDAVPILRTADEVRVTWVDPQKSLEPSGSLPGAELATALSRHGINVIAEGLPTSGITEGEALVSRVSHIGADLLVMGAYGHSRMREYVFGGATRFVLKSMTVPVLMSH